MKQRPSAAKALEDSFKKAVHGIAQDKQKPESVRKSMDELDRKLRQK